ncbi:chorismate mutase [Actinacidiphila epipremni]|jgi:chorismate mutase|uniref:Chorismate mutase n=1 Tax=Actinacidiphila epipremni TaxID=2053013 RepID=A0ABX0ZVJ5_9ACTN|nr:chorismate mutase [Actinacidiphila epipremni]
MEQTVTVPMQQPQPSAPEEVIAANRARIDDLDARIIALVQERMAASRAVQQARMGAGGRRVHLAREMEILRTYGDALGRPGTSVAMTLLELCRGTV